MELLLEIFLAVLTVFVVMAFYHEHPKAKIPHGFSQRRKLYFFHYVLNFAFGLTKLMRVKLGYKMSLLLYGISSSNGLNQDTYIKSNSTPPLSYMTYLKCEVKATELLWDFKAKFLEKVGITSEVYLLRTAMDGIPPLKDKHLFMKNLRFEKVKVRIYQPKMSTTGQRRGILYFHGGVGRFGSIRAYERTCRYLARKTNSVVVSVGYRLAPEHPYPTQFEDCLTATVHFMRTAHDYGVDPSRIIVCGDSSGGTLTAAVAQALVKRRDLPKLRAQILIYPYLQCVDFNLPSYQQNEGVPVLLKERTVALGLKYLDKDLSVMEAIFNGCHIPEDLQQKYQKWVSPDYIPHEFKTRGYKPSTTHPLFSKEVYTMVKPMFDTVFSPLLAEDSVIAHLPETFILTCEFDVLRDDGLLYKKRLEDHGIKVTWCHLQEGFHGTVFLALYGELIGFRSGSKGLAKIVNFLRLM